MPPLRAQTESGVTVDDPTDDKLLDMLMDIEQGDGEFLIVERTGDASGQTYAQAYLTEDGTWLVEHREGSPEKHYQACFLDRATTHRLLTLWAREQPDLQDAAAWERIAV